MSAFDKIIGYEKEKTELMRICEVLKNPARFDALGVHMPRAVLLHGKPGLGKTMMAKALIEESGRRCFSCRKNRADGQFVDNIRETFERAAESTPSVVFLDDMDKFAEDNLREDSNKEEFATIQSCMEDVRDKQVFVIATANDIDNLPSSLLRSGRFGRQIEVRVPSLKDAKAIIAHYLANKHVSKDISTEVLAYVLQGRSCAVLEEMINEAGIIAGYENATRIEKRHLIPAILRVTESVIPDEEKDGYNRRFIAYHESGHALAALAFGQKIGLLSIASCGDSGGICRAFSGREQICTMEDYREEIMTSLAGLAATELVFGERGFGGRSDVENACANIRSSHEKAGAFGFEYVYDLSKWDGKQAFARQDKITERVTEELNTHYAASRALLERNTELLHALATALLEQGTLLYDDVNIIVKEHPLT